MKGKNAIPILEKTQNKHVSNNENFMELFLIVIE
jgi:hypothetical protein